MDHCPLISILKNIKSDGETIRISQLKHTIIDWKFFAKNSGPDVLSRQSIVGNIIASNPVEKLDISKVKNAYKNDSTLQKLMFYVKKGFPNRKSDMELFTKECWKFRLNIIIKNDLLYYGDRLIVPDSLRKEVLKKLHGAHHK